MVATPEVMSGIANGYIGAPLIAPILGIIMLIFLYYLRADKVKKMQEDLAVGKTKATSEYNF